MRKKTSRVEDYLSRAPTCSLRLCVCEHYACIYRCVYFNLLGRESEREREREREKKKKHIPIKFTRLNILFFLTLFYNFILLLLYCYRFAMRIFHVYIVFSFFSRYTFLSFFRFFFAIVDFFFLFIFSFYGTY